MVSLIWATFSLVAGFGVYCLVPFVVTSSRVTTRQRVGKFYLKMATRCLKQFAFVRRVLSGYDVLPIHVDDEQKLLKVTLSSSTLGDDEEYPFKDPDNRIKRLWNKPVGIAYEEVPAATDAELAEIGHWVREHEINTGIIRDGKVDPYVPMSDSLRLVDPIDVFEIVTNGVDPENIKTVEELTKQRYAGYGPAIGLAETMSTLLGFGVGMAAMGVAAYVNQRILGNGRGGGGINNPIDSVGLPSLVDPTLVDLVVTLL